VSVNTSTHFDHEADEIARQFFTPDDLRLAPEEYVARNAQNIACFSLDQFRYADPELGAWVKRVGELLHTRGEVERCRELYLSADELDDVRKRDLEDW
jgi:hypothetical protein